MLCTCGTASQPNPATWAANTSRIALACVAVANFQLRMPKVQQMLLDRATEKLLLWMTVSVHDRLWSFGQNPTPPDFCSCQPPQGS